MLDFKGELKKILDKIILVVKILELNFYVTQESLDMFLIH